MNIESTSLAPEAVAASWIAIGVFEGETDAPAALKDSSLKALIAPILATKEVGRGVGETTTVFAPPGQGIPSALLVGLGARRRFHPGLAFQAGVAVSRRLASQPRETVAALVPDEGEARGVVSAWTEGLIVGTRGPGLRKSEPNRHPFGTLLVVAPPEQIARDILDGAVRRGTILGEAVNLARDLANTPPAEKVPTDLAGRARAIAEEAGLTATVWDEATIRAARFGGLLGVSAGSDQPPAFVILEHRGGGDAPTLALVGKGVTFDSGGLSLKPTASMEDMKSDMTGAAVVLATMQAAARLRLPVNLDGYMILAENMTGGAALKLGDVLTMRNGKTVEVLNTDAEGRLILADALSYAVEKHPARVLDLATLTGSCMVALGTKVAGLFGNDEAFCDAVLAASRRTGERVWRLPLDEDYKEALKSTVADLKNVGGKWGGAITAAKFLEEFVGATPWVHLDIAGPSWADSESATRDAGGTGCFVRTLIALIEAS